MVDDVRGIADRSNVAINTGDLAGLESLMTPDHEFIDGAGGRVIGRSACLDAWAGFFAAFPDYRNHFEEEVERGDGVAVVIGRSTCSEPALDGPARWRAVVKDGLVAVWQVGDP